MKLLNNIGKASNAAFYYEWGNEPAGYVTFARYENDVLKIVGVGPKDWAGYLNAPFHNPHS